MVSCIAKLRSVQLKIVDVNCICHLVNLCVKSAVKRLPVKVDDLLVDIYYHFRNCVNRVTSLHEFAEFCCVEYKCILKHCETRWLSLRIAINRTLETSTKVWLCFLSNALAVFDKFNVFFQTSSTSLSFMVKVYVS